MPGSRRKPERRHSAALGVQESGARPVRNEGQGRLVLVVDDVEDNRDIYAGYFAHHGFRVEEARDGAEALEKIAEEIPDVILMDLAMPVLDGWEATRRIKADKKTKHVLIVAVTGHVFGENLRRAEEAGADAVLTKPCRPDEVFEVVMQLLDR
ncbi:MAG TPA: response regulator [Labilithrix sp.]|jgi:CheY-like chemotaxis protein